MSLRLHRTSAGLDPATARPGRDLVLTVAPEHALALPDGVAIEDHLGPGERVAADRAALAALAAWRARRGETLHLDGVDLGHVAEVELLAGCFLPAELLARGLAAVGAAGEIEAVGFEAAALAALSGLAPPGCAVRGEAAPPPPPPPRGGRRDALVLAVERTRVPPWPRGEIVCVPYWHLVGVYTALVRRRSGPRPMSAGIGFAGLGRADIVRALARGGWGGSSGARARAASAARVAAYAARLAAEPAGADARERAIDGWALSVAAADAGAAPAQLAHFRRVVRGARLIVTPFDSPAEQRVLLAAGRSRDVPALVVQHGFKAGLNDPDMTLADAVAVWSWRDRDDLARRHARGEITVTGNPGGEESAQVAYEPPGEGRAVVLVDYPGRLSAQVGSRIPLQHVAAAITGLAGLPQITEIVVRPHPFDSHIPYEEALAHLRGGARLTVDRDSPIHDLLASADLCVGALSSATLQGAVLGVPTVFLDVSGAARPWPFDGSEGALPLARDAAELAELAATARGGAAGGAAEALGLTGSGKPAVLRLIDDLATGPA